MGWELRKHLHFCFDDKHTAFLDVAKDRYFAMEGAAHNAFRALVEPDAFPVPDERYTAQFIEAGLICPAKTKIRPEPCHLATTPTRSLIEAPWHSLPSIFALGALATASMRLKRYNLLWQVEHVQKHRLAMNSNEDDLQAAAEAFETSRRLVASHNKCLWRSLAMMEFLRGRGLHGMLVFGVKFYPFEAHCWVQANDAVLTDRLDYVRPYMPILVL